MMHLTLQSNRKGRDFFLSDVNACLTYLKSLLEKASFNESDRLFLIGNSINHGVENIETIEFLKRENIYPLLGYGELLMLSAVTPGLKTEAKNDAINQWDINGGEWRKTVTLNNFRDAVNFVSTWPLSITIEGSKRIGLVHSECPTATWSAFTQGELSGRDIMTALTSRARLYSEKPPILPDVDLVISGHTMVSKPPFRSGNCFYINHGIIVGKKAKLFEIKHFLI